MDYNNELLHLPDLQFSKYCEEQFAINKGIYNTIDYWFYRKGIHNILKRRSTLFQFLIYCCSKNEGMKFGPGGLSKTLESFWNIHQMSTKSDFYFTKV